MLPLPHPNYVRESLGIPGLFVIHSYKYVMSGLEIYGLLNLEGRPVLIRIHATRSDLVKSWPVIRGQVALQWQALRVTNYSQAGLSKAAMSVLEVLSKKLDEAEWTPIFQNWFPEPVTTWEFFERNVYTSFPDELMQLQPGSNRFELYVQLHTDCVQNCVFCPKYNASNDQSLQDRDLELVKALIEQVIIPAREKGIPGSIRLDSNDLSMHRHLGPIMDLISTESGCPLHVVVPTNRLSKKSMAVWFASLPGLYQLSVTIFGASSQSHDTVAGRPGAFVEAVNALKNLSTCPVSLNGHFVLTSHALGEIGSVMDILAHFSADIMIQFLLADCANHNEILGPILPRVDTVLEALTASADKIISTAEIVNVSIKDFPVCGVPMSLRHLASNDHDREILFEYPTPPCCATCARLKVCTGVPQAYLDLFGTAGLVPEPV